MLVAFPMMVVMAAAALIPVFMPMLMVMVMALVVAMVVIMIMMRVAMMMMPTGMAMRVVRMVAGGRSRQIGTAFGIERCLDLGELGAEVAQHFYDGVIVSNPQLLA